jgi:hypothetical protein
MRSGQIDDLIAPPLSGREGTQGMPRNLATRLTLLSFVLVRGAPALAGEHAVSDLPLRASALPPSFALNRPLPDPPFSATEFRPRRSSIEAADQVRKTGPILDAPLLQGTSLAQQMAQFKSQNRVRLLTLWQTQGSTLSLQAGRHGAPTLQWSTPWVNRAGANQGLLDHLLPSRAPSFRSPSAKAANAPVARPADFPPGISTK